MKSHITRVVSESKRASEGCSFALAERKGFEPLLEDYSKHDFQSCALDQLSHLSVQVAIRRRVGRTPATCVFYHTSQDLSRGFPKNAEKKLSGAETHSGVGSAVLPLRVRTRVRFFCAGAR